jgi:metal-responsive CopG/Arc/MetJ family transcriptional regulator
MMRIMMITIMRTTMSLDEDLLEQARKRAAAQGVSMSVIINRALRRGLAEPNERRVATPTVVYDPGTPPVDAAELQRRIAAAADEDLQHDAGL